LAVPVAYIMYSPSKKSLDCWELPKMHPSFDLLLSETRSVAAFVLLLSLQRSLPTSRSLLLQVAHIGRTFGSIQRQ